MGFEGVGLMTRKEVRVQDVGYRVRVIRVRVEGLGLPRVAPGFRVQGSGSTSDKGLRAVIEADDMSISPTTRCPGFMVQPPAGF